MLEIKLEPWAAVRDEIEPLWDALANDSRQSEEGPEPRGDIAVYDAAADDLIVVAYRHGGALVGFWFALVVPHPHYAGRTAVIGDAVYVRPEHRGPGIARALRLLMNEGKRRGAFAAFINSPVGRDFGPLLSRFGFRPTEVQHRAFL